VDSGHSRIRKVAASTGIITTIAGSESNLDVNDGRSGIATEYTLYRPAGVALDSAGNVFIAGGYNEPCIFKVTLSTGNIIVVAGIGTYGTSSLGYNSDDILATKAKLFNPEQVAFDASDNMFINDAGNYRIRRVSASTGIITTVAGTGEKPAVPASSSTDGGDGGSATSHTIFTPSGLDVAASGDFYISNDFFDTVKKVKYNTDTPSSSVTTAPAVTPASSSPIVTTPTVSSSSYPFAPALTPSTPSTATAPTPSASSPSYSPSISKAPSTSSTTGSQSSATTHVAQILHVTMILLSSLLILHLC
jgi:hypothetical protein